MAIIRITKADKMMTKVVPANIYTSEITNIRGPEKSSSGKSINTWMDIQICEGDYKGKARTICFSSGTPSPTMLGEMQFFPQAYISQVQAAALGEEMNYDDEDIDLDKLLNKPFDVSWGVATVEGHLSNTVTAFHTKGYGSQNGTGEGPLPF